MHPIMCNLFSANTCVLIILIGINLLASNVSCLKCYVCDASNCSDFNISNKDLFESKCPPKYVGCGTHKTGDVIISRTCEEYNVPVCSDANGISYCFCGGNLCNGLSNFVSETDDEDLTEGSGFTTPPPKKYNIGVGTLDTKTSSASAIQSMAVLVCNFIWLI